MKYKVKMGHLMQDKIITVEIEAKSVFDAIDAAANMISDPDNVELIEAIPITDSCVEPRC